jgi:crotonobetainyl-CoA:carnitine CoA-transferase CaiB-like acyl-CoA transferase
MLVADYSDTAPGPLAGFRVLELTSSLTGPMATMLLADQGADVLKLETGRGDLMRYAGCSRQGVSGMATVFLSTNRNKRSVVLDLKKPDDLDVARRIAAQCDAVVQNYRPGVVERLGLGYEDVRRLREDIVYVSIDGLGREGPDAGRRVYDLVIQGMAGFAAVQRDLVTGEPQMIRTAIVDKATALTVCQATTAALLSRERTGRGQHVRVSMLNVGVSFLWPDAMGAATLIGDDVNQFGSMATVRYTFRTKDGYLLAAAVSDAEWIALCEALERPDLAMDERFATIADRGRHSVLLNTALEDAFIGRTTDEWLVRLRDHDAIFARANDPTNVHEDPQVIALGAVRVHEHPVAGAYRQPVHPVHFGETPATFRRHAPTLGQHTDEVIAELGIVKERQS